MPDEPQPKARQFYVQKDGQEFGPYARTELQARIDSREFSRSDLGWSDGLDEWSPLGANRHFSFGHIPPPIESISPVTPLQWRSALRDVLVIFALSAIGGLIAGIAAGDIGTARFVLAAGVSNLLLCTVGFTISGCLVAHNRWRHLFHVAAGVWLVSAFNMFFGLSFLQWLLSSIFIGILMALGGGLSTLFKPNLKKPLIKPPPRRPPPQAITSSQENVVLFIILGVAAFVALLCYILIE